MIVSKHNVLLSRSLQTVSISLSLQTRSTDHRRDRPSLTIKYNPSLEGLRGSSSLKGTQQQPQPRAPPCGLVLPLLPLLLLLLPHDCVSMLYTSLIDRPTASVEKTASESST